MHRMEHANGGSHLLENSLVWSVFGSVSLETNPGNIMCVCVPF